MLCREMSTTPRCSKLMGRQKKWLYPATAPAEKGQLNLAWVNKMSAADAPLQGEDDPFLYIVILPAGHQ